MVESLTLCLQLLMLLGNVIYNQSDAMQYCPLQKTFPNFTAEAGSPFYFSIHHNATQKHLRQSQISLASGKDLPSWMEYRHDSGHLVGLALPEDCGGLIHYLQLSVTTDNCTAHFFLHIRNATIPGNSPKRGTLLCPDREISVWGNLLLHMNPVHLNASRRIHLVDTMADYHHLLRNSISLLSSRNLNVPHHTMLRVCGPSDLQEKGFERDGILGNFTQILWHFGCKSQEQQLLLQDELNNAFETGILIKQLDVQVIGWRLLCTVEVAHRVKRELRLDLSASQFTSTMEQGNSEGQTLTQTNDITSNHFLQSSDIYTFSSDRGESEMRTSPSFEENITPVPSAVTHVSGNFERPPASLTPGPDQDHDILTQTYGYSDSESPHLDPLKSPDHSDLREDFGSPSVSDHYQTETYDVSLSFSTTDRSLQSSDEVFSTQMFFPTPHMSQPSNNEQTGPKIPPSVSGAGQEAITRLNTIVTDSTPTALVSQTWSIHVLESSMYASFTTGAAAYTPPLPFAYSTSQLLATYDSSSSFTARDISNSQVSSSTPQNELLESNFSPEFATDSSDLCAYQLGQTHCSGFLETSEPTADQTSLQAIQSMSFVYPRTNRTTGPGVTYPDQASTDGNPASNRFEPTTDDLHFQTSLQAIQSMSIISEQTEFPSDYSEPSFIHLSAVILPESSFVSFNSSSVHANLNTTTTTTSTTGTTGPSVTYPDQVPTGGISAAASNRFETITGQQSFTSSTSHLLETSTLYSSVFLTSRLMDASSHVLQTEMITVGTISTTQKYSEASSYHSDSPEPTEYTHTPPLLREYSTIEPSWTSGNINPTVTRQHTSILQGFSSITPHGELETKTQSEWDIADVCSEQNGRSYCFGVLLTSEFSSANLPSFPSTLEDLQLQTTGERVERSQQTHFLKPPFTTSLPNTQTMLFTDTESEYGLTSNTVLSDTPSTPLLPSAMNSIFDLAASGSTATTSFSEVMSPLTVHERHTETTMYLFDSLQPSFPLCKSVDLSKCASTVVSVTQMNTDDYWTFSRLVDETYWTSEVGLSGKMYSATWQNAGTEEYLSLDSKSKTYFTTLASQNYLSASHQIPSETLTPSYRPVTSLSIMTFSTIGPTKPTYFSLYSAVSTTFSPFLGHSSSHIIKQTTSSITATSTVNFPPRVLQTVPALTAIVGFPFSYSIPENTFVDPEDGAALSLEMRLIAPPPASVGSWLSLEGLELHGVPLEMDTRFAPQRAILLSRDKGGLSASMTISVDLYRNPVRPCHVFTISAHLSLHSVLLHRHKVELFLTKVSRYFNNTVANHLSIVSISSGSTVVSWYNSSLCNDGKCLYENVNRMWLAMRFENGTINPKFRDATLPEFPLINVEPVAYAHDCFPLTHDPTTAFITTSEQQVTSNASTSTSVAPAPTQVAPFGTMAAMFIALLVICSLILTVLFVAVIAYFYRRAPAVVAIFPAGGMPSVRSVDPRALRPRRALLLHPEIPPPPLRLWISPNPDDDQIPSEIQLRRMDSDAQELSSEYNI